MLRAIGAKVDVVPFAGTWIETAEYACGGVFTMSFPSRERGLKHSSELELTRITKSFPSRERGLKPEGIWVCV